MPDDIRIHVNGSALAVPRGTTVAAALLRADTACRTSVTGMPRGPLCGMGICFECRAVVDGLSQRRTCLITCVEGMSVETQP